MKLLAPSSQLFSTDELLDPERYDNDPDSPPARLPDYYTQLERIVRRAAKNGIHELPLILYARVSDPRPGQRDTTGDQLHDIQKEVRRLEKKCRIELPILDDGEFCEQVSGSEFSKRKRSKLVQAAKLAKVRYAVLVAFDPSRFVRNEDYRQLPTVADCEAIKRLTGNVQLATIMNPIKHEHRSRSTKRGLKAKKKKTYQPSFDKVQNEFARVVKLREQDMSWPKIAKAVGRAESTIRGWYKASQE